MNICLDFDGVLHDTSTAPPGGRLGGPVEGARQACWDLMHAGHHLIVHSSRAHSERDFSWLDNWLSYWDFPFMEHSWPKPRADVYVDDKGMTFQGWALNLPALLGRAHRLER